MNILKKARLDSRLPATPCSNEMREKMEIIAQKEGASLAEVQRSAFEFFLQNADKLVIGSDIQIIGKVVQA